MVTLPSTHERTIFVAWDSTTTGGLKTTLEALAWSSDTQYRFDIPGIQPRSGEILRDVVLDGIRLADRVLVVVDRPNANVPDHIMSASSRRQLMN